MTADTTTWVSWHGSTRRHAAPGVRPADVRVGSFPLACGRWAPDPMDVNVDVYADVIKRRCARCAAIMDAPGGPFGSGPRAHDAPAAG